MIRQAQKARITAAICTYNRYNLLENSIASLVAQNIEPDQYRIIIVDNSPANPSAKEFKDRYEQRHDVQYILEASRGLSNARNVAARTCNTEYIAYLDDDALADPDWLKSILEAFDKCGSQAGIVCGKVNPIWPTEPPTWLPPTLFSALTIVDWGDSMRIAQPGQGFAGTNFSIRVAPLLELGGFSLSLGRVGNGDILLSNEDLDLIERMRGAGYETIWAPDAKVDHLIGEERISQRWLRKRYVWQAVSDFIADPAAAVKNLELRWQSVSDYMQHCPPALRGMEALFESVDDPKLFEKQIWATYCLTVLLLAGGESLDAACSPRIPARLKRADRVDPRELMRSIFEFLKKGN